MKKILIVEDNDKNRDILIQLLEDDYQLFEAVDGEAGVRMASEVQPDLILMDLSLPRLDGWEATRRIKADPAVRNIPVIAVTAHAMVGDRDKALQAGADDYLSKPIFPTDLFAKISRFLEDA